CRLHVLSGEHGCHVVGFGAVLERETNSGAHASGGASADGVDDHHGGAWLSGDGAVDIGGGAQFLNTQAREFFAHGNDHDFRVHAFSLVSVLIIVKDCCGLRASIGLSVQ